MKHRPDESSRSLVDKSGGGIRPGSERNRKFAEDLERRTGVAQQVRRKPLSTRLGSGASAQGGARGFLNAIKRTPTKSSAMAGRVGKRLGERGGRVADNSSRIQANQALRKAELMLRNTERELAQIKRKKTTSTRVGNKPVRGGGQSGRGGRGGQTGRGGRGGRGGGRGGASGRKTSDVKVSQDDLDKQLDSYMLKTKGGLDAQMDDYMSKTKGGLDKQMDDYMAESKKSDE